jgi:threonine dehydrogenase-like Zn-dependent dehydrogenase
VVDTDITAVTEQAGGFDPVVDATGASTAMQTAFDSVRKGGRFMVVGVAPPEARLSISPFRIYNGEITILGSTAVLDSCEPALRLIAEGTVSVDPLLTHTLPIDGYVSASDLVRRGEGVKIQILPGDG